MTEDNEYAKPALLAEIDMKSMRPEPTNVSDMVGKITKAMEWQTVPQEAEKYLLADAANGNHVLAFEDGRYYNAWLEFDEYEGGWLWMDDADSEPSPTHYMLLPKPPGETSGNIRTLLSALSSRASLLEEARRVLEATEEFVIDGITAIKSELEMNLPYPKRAPRFQARLDEARAVHESLRTLKAKLSQENDNGL